MSIIPVTKPPLVGFSKFVIERTVAVSRNTHLDLSDFTVFTQAEWLSSTPKRLIVPTGVTINSETVSYPALRTGTTAFGGSLELLINGTLNGAGGQPNSGGGGYGLAINSAGAKLKGSGIIRGGGGAGGAGGYGGPGYYYTTGQDGPAYSANQYMWYTGVFQQTTYQTALYWAGSNIANITSETAVTIGSYTYYRGAQQSTSSDNNWVYTYYAIYRQYTVTNYTSGGAGGNGGRGQGGDGAAAGGSPGGGGGTNAGSGGYGGTGGAFGQPGGTGATGNAGNNGGGGAGSAGGAAGYSINRNAIALDMTGWTGTLVGAMSA